MDTPPAWQRSIDGPGYWIGEFHCNPASDRWRTHNQISGGPVMVFPGTAVEIQQDGHDSLIADPNHAVFYNDRQPYRRRMLDGRGDHCAYFGLSGGILAEIIAEHDPAVHARLDAPYRYGAGPVTSRDYLRHLAIFRAVVRDPAPDHLFLCETLITLFQSVIGASYRAREGARLPRRSTRHRRHREAAREMQRVLGTRYREALSLGDIADAVDLSPFHAARVFREHTGYTIHGYRSRLRLVAGLRQLGDAELPLTALALDLGYSSHSHFTAAFRRAFGVTPSAARRMLHASRAGTLADLHARDAQRTTAWQRCAGGHVLDSS